MTVPETDRPDVVVMPPAPGGVPATLLGLVAAAALAWFACDRLLVDRSPILVGLLHARTGPQAAGEQSLLDGELLALEEINRAGGLLGRPVRWVVADAGADAAATSREAERLIRQERVAVIFGCGSPAARRSVVPVVETNDHLLLFPGPHEGLERSAHVFATGATPNQQVAPAVQWCRTTLSARRFLVVSTEGLWPRAVAALAADQITAVGGEIVGQADPSGGATTPDAAPRLIGMHAPDVVICAMPGGDAVRFLEGLRAAGVEPDRVPVVAIGLGEDDLRGMAARDAAGNYAAGCYFQSVDRPENLAFVRSFKTRFGEDRVAAAGAVAAADGVRLWAQAVREAGSADARQVRHALRHQSLDGPAGVVAIDPDTQHTWRPSFVARLRQDGQFDVVWGSRTALRPVPFPATRPRSSWERFADDLRRGPAATRPAADTADTAPSRAAEATAR